MGKSKKKRVADFQKVKFKVGKQRPAGANVTVTSFKTSRIHIASQLQQTSEPTNKKNRSLKELLGQLNHYNVTIRHDALIGMRDLFQEHPKVMHAQVSVWLSKILGMCTDSDPAVRHALHLCFGLAIKNLEKNQVAPFMTVIMAYVSCGLTHIKEEVQMDSLTLLDMILETFPDLFATHGEKVLHDVLGLVSKQSSKETSSSQSLSGTKVKSMSSIGNVDSRAPKTHLTSLKMRTKILEKLNKILLVLMSIDDSDSSSSSDKIVNSTYVCSDKESYVEVFRYGLESIELAEVAVDVIMDFDSDDCFSKQRCIDKDVIVDAVFPVLIHCWVEYGPAQLLSGILDRGSISTTLSGMNIVLNTTTLIVRLLCAQNQSSEINSRLIGIFSLLSSQYFKDFNQYFISYFPFPFNTETASPEKTLKPGKLDAIAQFAVTFNYSVGWILCSMLNYVAVNPECNAVDVKQLRSWIQKLISFVNLFLKSNTLVLQANDAFHFLDILWELFVFKKAAIDSKELLLSKCKLKESDIDIASMLKQISYSYSRASLKSKLRTTVIGFFRKLLGEGLFIMNDPACREEVEAFLQTIVRNMAGLPCSSIILLEECAACIKLAVVRKFDSVHFQHLLLSSLLDMTDLKGIFRNLPENLQVMLLEIIYCLGEIPGNLLRNLAILCSSSIPADIKKRVINIVSLCAMSKSPPSINQEMFVSFILSVIVGYSADELKGFSTSKTNCVSWSKLHVFRGILREVPVEHAIEQLKLITGYRQLWSLLGIPIRHILLSFNAVPVNVAAGLIKLLERLWTWKSVEAGSSNWQIDTSETGRIVALIPAILFYAVSESYTQLYEGDDSSRVARDERMEDDLVCSTISLLARNVDLLRLLLRKLKRFLKDNKTDSGCASCVLEVLLCLVQDERLQIALGTLKDHVSKLVASFRKVVLLPAAHSRLQDLTYQVSVLHER